MTAEGSLGTQARPAFPVYAVRYFYAHAQNVIVCGRTIDIISHTPHVKTERGLVQRRFDRVKRSTNRDHVRHKSCIQVVFTTVPSDFRLDAKLDGLI